MRVGSRIPAALIALMLLLLCGCGKSDLSTPKSAAQTFTSALEAGDAEAAKRASTGGDPKMVEALANASGSFKKLRDAAISKFGDEGKSVAGAPGGAGADASKKIDDADVQITGDSATVTPKGSPGGVKLKNVGGDWKVDVTEMVMPLSGNGMAMFDKMAQAAREVASDIDAGKYKSAQEAKTALSTKMMGMFKGG